MNYTEASKQLYIKKTDIEFSIGLIKEGNEFIPRQSSPLLEALNMAIKSIEKQIPKSALETQELMDIEYICPICDCNNAEYHCYCFNCGQSLEK